MYKLYNYFLDRKWTGPFWATAFRAGLRLRDALHATRDAVGVLRSPTPALKAPPPPGALRKILIVRVDRVGDIVLSTPALRALRRALPEAKIDYLVQAKYARLLDSYEGWNEVVRWEDIDDAGERGRLAALLRARGYDAAVIGSTAPAGYRVAREAGIPIRVGWKTKGFGHTLSAGFDDDRGARDRHQVENNVKLLAPLGVFDPAPEFPFRATATGRRQVEAFLAKAGIAPDEKVLVLHPGSFTPRVRWAPERFAEVAVLAARHGMRTVLLGAGPVERALVESISGSCGDAPGPGGGAAPVAAVDAFDLEGLPAFLNFAHVVVGNSTGPLHIAASAGAWTIGIFGSRYPLDRHELWSPWGPRGAVVETRGRPCCGMPWTCEDMHCLADIPASQVWEAVREAWEKPRPGLPAENA
jgi:ADP-heptose:LPS heptosyltransferase